MFIILCSLYCFQLLLLVYDGHAVGVVVVFHCVAGVAPFLGELVAQTVTVLNEYVAYAVVGEVIGELTVLDDVTVVDVE